MLIVFKCITRQRALVCNGRKTATDGLEQFLLHTLPRHAWRQRDIHPVQMGLQVGDVTGKNEVNGGQHQQARWNFAAQKVEFKCAGSPFPDFRNDLGCDTDGGGAGAVEEV